MSRATRNPPHHIYLKKIILSLITLFHLQTTPTTRAIRLRKISDGYTNPLAIVDPKDGTRRLFVVQKNGIIQILNRTTRQRQSTPFLDVSGRLNPANDASFCGDCGEKGLLGLAFHPNYKSNGYFFINYTQRDASGVFKTIVSRWEVDGQDGNLADGASERIILEIEQPRENHNAGDLQFGPDGYLYIPTGDGGGAGDNDNYSQRKNTLLGKMLRIDVDNTSNNKNYAIPSDNPFVSTSGALDEIWAFGLRNPWRISFDRTTGDLFIGDVGQYEWEEIDFQPAGSTGGENYGWRVWEGNNCFAGNCPAKSDEVFPILEYSHDDGCSVTGGYRYRGRDKGLKGVYFYADYCSGNIWGAKLRGGRWRTTLATKSGNNISSFGEDSIGNVYVASLRTGEIFQILSCRNNKKFRINNKSCSWIGRKQKRKRQFCKKKPVFNNCKAACSNLVC